MAQFQVKAAPLVLALLGAGVIGGAGVEALHSRVNAAPAPVAISAPAPVAPALAAATLPDFPRITERYGPAVVNISVSGTRKAMGVDAEDLSDPFELFRRFQQGQGRGVPRDVPVRGMGSGFIVSADGIILTNAHVVKDANEVTVKLTDRREFRAKVLGTDARPTSRCCKIEARNLPVVTLGNGRTCARANGCWRSARRSASRTA